MKGGVGIDEYIIRIVVAVIEVINAVIEFYCYKKNRW